MSGTKEATNPENAMRQWAAHCEKELTMSDKWFENWSEVFFPGKNPGNTDARIEELKAKAEELKKKEMTAKEKRAQVKLESFASPYARSSQELLPAYPY